MIARLFCALRRSLVTSHGWNRRFYAFLLGTAAALSLPPIFALPLLFPAYMGLFWLIENGDKKSAFSMGWWWGWGFFIVGTYWISISLLTDAPAFGWLIPFAVFGLTGFFALYPALACLLTRCFPSRGLAQIIVFAGMWTLSEYLRGHWFGGFPWNLISSIWAFSTVTLQPAALVGAYGMGWFTVLVFVLPVLLIKEKPEPKISPLYWRVNAIVLVLVVLIFGWSGWRLHKAKIETVPDVTLRLVQANIPQHRKWIPELQADGLRKHIVMSQLPGSEKITHIIWPETAMPYTLSSHSTLDRMLAQHVPPGGALITGAIHTETVGDDWKIWNSIQALDEKGRILETYDKHKLVPFGEFVPWRQWLPINKITHGMKDFSSGIGPRSLAVKGLPLFSPLICYETIFPEAAIDRARRPGWLLNLTNDAWFGNSSGPYQHLHMARMRAVEQGLPLIRVANSGITATIDPYGRILQYLPLNTEGVLDTNLPLPIKNGTLYSRLINFPTYFLIGISLITAIINKKITFI